MLIGIVQGAAPAPLAEAGAAAVPSGDTPAFDETLDAATLDASAAPATSAPAAEPPERRHADPLALAEWMLIGVPAQEPPAAPLSQPLSGMADDSDRDEPAAIATKGDAWWDIPVDVLLAPPVPVQDLPLRPAEPASSAHGDVVVTVTPTVESAVAVSAAPTVANGAARGLVPAPKEEFTALEDAQERFAAPAVKGTPAAQRSPAPAPAADVPGNVEPVAAAPETFEAGIGGQPTRLDRRLAINADAARATASPSVAAESMATVSASSPAQAAPALGDLAAAVSQQAVQTVVTAAAPAGSDTSAQAGGSAPARQAALAQTPPFDSTAGNGASNHGYGEGEGRRSPAAARLAAALSASETTAERNSGSAPVFGVPAAPAATPPVSAPVTVAAPEAAASTPDAENVQKLIQTMRVAARSGGWEATVRLKPEHLGEVSISLRVDGSNVSAMVQAEASGVRQWLRAQEDVVRSGLAEQGLQLDRFVVDRDGRQHGQQPEQQRQRRPPRRQAVPTDRFEIVV